MTKTSNEIEKKDESHALFRCHRFFIVNLYYVYRYKNRALTFQDGTMIPVGKEYVNRFKYRLHELDYLGEQKKITFCRKKVCVCRKFHIFLSDCVILIPSFSLFQLSGQKRMGYGRYITRIQKRAGENTREKIAALQKMTGLSTKENAV